jgi:hypothetical protein
MQQLTPHVLTQGGIIRSRFDMFVVLTPEALKQSRKNSRTWCHRGDKFHTEPNLQLQDLIKFFKNHFSKWHLAELYDNTIPKDAKERIVLRYKEGIIEVNRIIEYNAMLQNFYLPEILQP